MRLILSGVTGSGVETIARIIATRLGVPSFRGDDLGYRTSPLAQAEWVYRDELLDLCNCHVRGTSRAIPEDEQGISAIIPITDGSDHGVVDRLERLNPHDLIVRCVAPSLKELERRRNLWRREHDLPLTDDWSDCDELHPNDMVFLALVPPRSEFVVNRNIFASILEILEICNIANPANARIKAALALFAQTPQELLSSQSGSFRDEVLRVDALTTYLANQRDDGAALRSSVVCGQIGELLHAASRLSLINLDSSL